MKRTFGLWIISILLMAGCVHPEILDDIGLEIGRGYDRGEGDSIIGTTLIYNFQPDKSVENITASATATTTRDLVNKLQRMSPDPIAEGSLEIFLLSKELATDGLINYLDAPQRNASIGARLHLIVVDGSAKELLSGNYGNRGNAIFISNLLNHNIKFEDMPRSNLHIFFHDYYQLGKTGYLPEIKKVNDEVIELTGISLFKGETLKVVDKIEKDEMFYFKLLVDKYSEGAHKIDLGKDEAVVRSIRSKHKIKLIKKNPFQITIDLKIKGVIREHTGRKLTPKIIKEIEKTMEEETSKQCEELIKRFKEKKIDPVGLGFYIKTHTRGFNLTKDWEDGEEYQSVKVKVNTDVKIVESGVIE
jgi:spore germination protein